MSRIRVRSTGTVLAFALSGSLAAAAPPADHLQCFKIRDTATKVPYTADVAPTDPNFPTSNCRVQVPAKLLCVDVVKSNVTPAPPGAPAGDATHKFLCYKAKCPKATPTATLQDQFGSHTVTVKSTGLLCAPVTPPTTTTTMPTCVDADNDGFQAPPCGNDCNDANPAVNPMAVEICNGIDDNCNGMVDEGLGQTSCGIGACQNTVQNCVMGMPQTCVPGMPTMEICGNGIDDDCDGQVDEAPCGCTMNGQCPSPQNAMGACQSGMCTFTCDAGFADCNNNPVDGCEVAILDSDPSNCGGCGTTCPPATPTCSGGVCM
jgi:putative metal-binding protein